MGVRVGSLGLGLARGHLIPGLRARGEEGPWGEEGEASPGSSWELISAQIRGSDIGRDIDRGRGRGSGSNRDRDGDRYIGIVEGVRIAVAVGGIRVMPTAFHSNAYASLTLIRMDNRPYSYSDLGPTCPKTSTPCRDCYFIHVVICHPRDP